MENIDGWEDKPVVDDEAGWEDRPTEYNPRELEEAQFALKNPILGTMGGKKALDLAENIGNKVDIYSGSRATRRGVGKALDTPETPQSWGPAGFLANVGKEMGQSYGQDLPAPSGKEIVQKTEVGKKLPPWAQSAAGFGTEVLLDPSLAIPTGLVSRTAKTGLEGASLAAKGTGKFSKGLVKGAVKAADVLVPGTERVIKTGVNEARGIADSLVNLVRPQFREDIQRVVETAVKHGVDPATLPASAKFKNAQDSTVSQMERAYAKGVTGEPRRESFTKGLNQTRAAYDKNIGKFTNNAPPLNPTDAGESLRNGYHRVVDDFFQNNDVTYDTAWKTTPGLKVDKDSISNVKSTIHGLRRDAQRNALRGATPEIKSQGEAVLNILDNAEDVVSSGNYKQSVELMRELGEVGFKKRAGVLPENAKAHRDLYHAISEGLIDTTRKKVSPDLANELVKRNEGFTEFFKQQKLSGMNFDDATISGESIFKKAIETGDSTRVRALKEIFKNDPNTLNQLKATFLDSLKTVDADGGFSFRRLNNQLNNDPKIIRVINELFSPEERTSIKEIVQLGDDFGPPVMSGSPTQPLQEAKRWIRSVPETMSSQWIVDYLQNKAKIPPGAKGFIDQSGSILGHKPPMTGSPTAKFVSGIAADPLGAVKDYAKGLKPTSRQMLGKSMQEYGIHQEQKRKDQESPEEIIGRVMSDPSGKRYSQVLQKALQRGPESFHSTVFLMGQSDPEFRKLMNPEEGASGL